MKPYLNTPRYFLACGWVSIDSKYPNSVDCWLVSNINDIWLTINPNIIHHVTGDDKGVQNSKLPLGMLPDVEKARGWAFQGLRI